MLVAAVVIDRSRKPCQSAAMSTKPAYRPDIDGLRAIAVLSVVLYHYGATWLPGGFTGVDVFFVISGYLITGILRREIERGEFSLLNFYARRIRRIIPALFVVLLATLAVGWFVLMPGDFAELGSSAAYAAVGFGNFFFLGNTGYFDQAADLQPLLHTWSLGVEEQFYFVWPILLFLGLTLVRSRKVFLILFALAVALAFAYSIRILGKDVKGAFYLPAPRAWELAIGAFVAFLPAIKSRVASLLATITGLLLVAGSLLFINSDMPFPGPAAALACVVAALITWDKRENLVSSVLSIRPLVWIGLISYSLYLWHWPVLVLYRHYSNGRLPSLEESSALMLVSIALAYASWRFVEQPTRHIRMGRWKAVGAGLAAAGVVAIAGVTTANSYGFPDRVAQEAAQMSSLDVMWQWSCEEQEVPELGGALCVFGGEWASSPRKVILWGDSHAEHAAPLVQSALAGSNSAVALVVSCPAALGGSVRREWAEVPGFVQSCEKQRETVLAAIGTGEIEALILAASWNPLARVVSSSTSEADGKVLVAQGLTELFETLEKMPRQPKVYLIDQFPNFSRDPVACELAQTSGLSRSLSCDDNPRNAFEWSAEKQAVSFPGFENFPSRFKFVTIITPRQSMCASGECQTRLNGEFLFRDATHIRRNLSAKTIADLSDQIGMTAALSELAN